MNARGIRLGLDRHPVGLQVSSKQAVTVARDTGSLGITPDSVLCYI